MAIDLFAAMLCLPRQTKVMPIVDTECQVILAAELHNQELLIGQCGISHPATGPTYPTDCRNPNLLFDKTSHQEPLASPIRRVFYVDEKTNSEIRLKLNPAIVESLQHRDVVIFSAGSLYTSLLPLFIFPDMAPLIEAAPCKILILNSFEDRETEGMTGFDFVVAIFSG